MKSFVVFTLLAFSTHLIAEPKQNNGEAKKPASDFYEPAEKSAATPWTSDAVFATMDELKKYGNEMSVHSIQRGSLFDFSKVKPALIINTGNSCSQYASTDEKADSKVNCKICFKKGVAREPVHFQQPLVVESYESTSDFSKAHFNVMSATQKPYQVQCSAYSRSDLEKRNVLPTTFPQVVGFMEMLGRMDVDLKVKKVVEGKVQPQDSDEPPSTSASKNQPEKATRKPATKGH